MQCCNVMCGTIGNCRAGESTMANLFGNPSLNLKIKASSKVYDKNIHHIWEKVRVQKSLFWADSLTGPKISFIYLPKKKKKKLFCSFFVPLVPSEASECYGDWVTTLLLLFLPSRQKVPLWICFTAVLSFRALNRKYIVNVSEKNDISPSVC